MSVFDFHAVIAINPGQVKDVVEKFGGQDWYTRYIRETFRTYVRDAAQRYDSVDLKSKRDLLAQEVKQNMSEYVKGTPFNLVNLIVGNIDYPDVCRARCGEEIGGPTTLSRKRNSA